MSITLRAIWGWLTARGRADDMPGLVYVGQILWALGLLAVFLAFIHGQDRLDLPHSFGKVPVEAPWLGAVGGLLASLAGISAYGRGKWQSRFDYWHPVKPLMGAASGSVACLLTIVLVRTVAGGKAPTLDNTVLDAVAFVFGFAESSFRELIKTVTDVFLRPGGKAGEKDEGKEVEPTAKAPAARSAAAPTSRAEGGSWLPLQNQPAFPVSTMLLLTDGSVMVLEMAPGARPSNACWQLSPDASGSYVNGSWSPLAPMHNSRLYFASAVLADGRVIVAGGEWSDAGDDLDGAEIFDPVANVWTPLGTPGWGHLGDAAGCLLSDNRLLIGDIMSPKTALFDPTTDEWSEAAGKRSRSSEETWTLQPDGTVLTVQTFEPSNAEKYLPDRDEWVSASVTPAEFVQASSFEIGPAILLPGGDVFCIGATGHTALYTPPAQPGNPGTWASGPDFPADSQKRPLKAKDAPAALLPSGNVLCVAGPAGDEADEWPNPVFFFEYDPQTNSLARVVVPPNANTEIYAGRMLLLPTGQVLYAAGSEAIYAYTPLGKPQAAWRPTVSDVPETLQVGQGHPLTGRQLNGLSQAVSYGDDAQMATNYPLILLISRADGGVRYCRTRDHSTMAVATGSEEVSTRFDVPADLALGQYDLRVVANGIASDAIGVNVVP